METMKQSGPRSSLGTHMGLSWSCDGYAFPVVVEPEILTFKLNLTLKVKVNHPQTRGILTEVFCTPGANLVILAWMGDELWCGQAQYGVNLVNFEWVMSYHMDKLGDGWMDTHTQTDAGNNTRMPKLASGKKAKRLGSKWLVKSVWCLAITWTNSN